MVIASQPKGLSAQGFALLKYLVAQLPKAIPGRPDTFVSYKSVHDALGLPRVRAKYGDSLSEQGLGSLAGWLKENNYPAITGLIVREDSLQPGYGYFDYYNNGNEDYAWWASEIAKSKTHEWPIHTVGKADRRSQELNQPTPLGSAFPAREEVLTNRVVRETALGVRVKQLHKYACQVCGKSITLPSGAKYAEAHHIKPLGMPHSGPDQIENIMCVCPNHHVELDYGVISINANKLRSAPGHSISEEWIRYHNENVFIKLRPVSLL